MHIFHMFIFWELVIFYQNVITRPYSEMTDFSNYLVTLNCPFLAINIKLTFRSASIQSPTDEQN